MPASPLLEAATRVDALLDAAFPTDGEVVETLRAIGELRRLVDAVGAGVAADLERRCEQAGPDGPAERGGYASAGVLIEATTGLEPAEVAAWRRVGAATAERIALSGEVLPSPRPLLARALTCGALGMGAAARIVRTLDDAARLASSDEVDGFERTLVDCAPHLSSRELRAVARRITDLVDPDGAEPRDDLLRARSRVTVRQQDDGLTRVTALLHPEAAGLLLTALDARTAPRRSPVFAEDAAVPEPDDPDDPRPLAQRRVDALAGIARDALGHDRGRVAGAPVTVVVTVGLDQLTSGLGTARISGIDEPISAATARRMASDAEIIPIVLGGGSEILDQGTRKRLATPAQRRALDLRDGGCLFGRCDAPPGWCEVAHVIPWARGGPTDLANLALLCPRHHRLFDRDGWGLRWSEGTPWLIPPAHTDPLRTPRRAGRAMTVVA